MWAYHCPTRTLPPPLFLSLTLPYSLSRSLPGSCIFNPLSSSLSQGTRHVEQQLRFFFFFLGGSDCFMTHLPQLVAIECVARVALWGAPSCLLNHICHMRDFQHVIWRSPASSFIPHSKSESVSKSKIEFNTPKSSVCNQWAIRLLERLEPAHTPCAINA